MMTGEPRAPQVARDEADQAALLARVFHGLSDPTRLRIVQLLLAGEKNVGELVQELGAPQGRVSSHLMCLRWCGFVTTRRQGKHVYYRVSDPRVAELVRLAHHLLVEHAQAIASCQIMTRETLAEDDRSRQ
jgi:ArsR family transcriptional regulator, cadmium/lead-responsive transcriptional repressor